MTRFFLWVLGLADLTPLLPVRLRNRPTDPHTGKPAQIAYWTSAHVKPGKRLTRRQSKTRKPQ